MLRHEPIRDELRQLRESYISVTGVVIIFLVEAQEQLHYSSLLPINDLPRGCSVNEKERSWKVDMFRHQNFENRTGIEGVMALTIKIFQNTQCRHHLTPDWR